MEMPEQFFTVYQETWLFLGSCLLGVPVGMLVDGFRLLRCLFPHHAAVVFVEDVLVVCAAAVLIQCYAVLFARSQLRGYDAVGCLCGFGIYFVTIGSVWGRMLRRVRVGRTGVTRLFSRLCCGIWQKIHAVFVRSPEK